MIAIVTAIVTATAQVGDYSMELHVFSDAYIGLDEQKIVNFTGAALLYAVVLQCRSVV